jgi:alkylation response protein AidB-like acyl-CoA dehydrogenase
MGRALVPGAFLSTVAFAGCLVDRAGSPEQRKKYLEAICEGRARATVALLEETASWDPGEVRLEAQESGSGVQLNGRKLFVGDAPAADFIITAARAGDDLILAAAPGDSPGLRITVMPSMDATRTLCEVVYEGVKVAPGAVLARGMEARRALDYALDVATMSVSAEMVGAMQKMLDGAVEYAKTRKQFGKPIGQFQAVQHHCANMLLMTESARSAVYYAAWMLSSDPEQSALAVSIAKMYASDAVREVGNLAVQVHGGIGFTWDEDLHFYYKRAKAAELMFGDARYHRDRIARLVIG